MTRVQFPPGYLLFCHWGEKIRCTCLTGAEVGFTVNLHLDLFISGYIK